MCNCTKDVKTSLSDADKHNQPRPFFSFQGDKDKTNVFFKADANSADIHTNGVPDVQMQGNPIPQTQAMPCPASVSIGSLAPFNHSNLPAAEKDNWGTYLGVTSQMNVGPGPDHTGHCMKETLTTVSNNCPAQAYSRGGGTDSQPCAGNRCLDINRYGSAGDASTHSMLNDGPASFIDMHRTRHPSSLLAGSGVSTCTVVCEQVYACDRTQATTGRFRITRNFQAGTHTKSDGSVMDITTGNVTKQAVQPAGQPQITPISQPAPPHGPLGDFNITDEIKHTA